MSMLILVYTVLLHTNVPKALAIAAQPTGFLSTFRPREGGKLMRMYGLLGGRGGKYISMCKACDKIGESRGMLPQEILILDFY